MSYLLLLFSLFLCLLLFSLFLSILLLRLVVVALPIKPLLPVMEGLPQVCHPSLCVYMCTGS